MECTKGNNIIHAGKRNCLLYTFIYHRSMTGHRSHSFLIIKHTAGIGHTILLILLTYAMTAYCRARFVRDCIIHIASDLVDFHQRKIPSEESNLFMMDNTLQCYGRQRKSELLIEKSIRWMTFYYCWTLYNTMEYLMSTIHSFQQNEK